jgi:hypothetical protein
MTTTDTMYQDLVQATVIELKLGHLYPSLEAVEGFAVNTLQLEAGTASELACDSLDLFKSTQA